MSIMKRWIVGIVGIAIVSGCQRHAYERGVLQKTYVHTYGVEVPPDEWTDRGQNGEVVVLRKDGVTITNRYVEGVLHGEITYSYPHSKVVEKSQGYEQGALVSETTYYRCGGPKHSVQYLSDMRKKITHWYETGEPQWVEEWDGDLLVCGEYYTPQHVLEAYVENGSGVRLERDMYGALYRQEYYQDGCRVLTKNFYSHGVVKEVIPERDGKVHGLKQHFCQDGSPMWSEEWNNGRRHGITTLYDNGAITARVPYLEDRIHGTEHRYSDNQELASRITWHHGMRHGPTYHYAGKQVTTEWYYQDKPITASNFALLSNYKPYTQIKD